jgi:hypothetical protein
VRVGIRFCAALAITFAVLAESRGGASAASASLKLTPNHGRISESFDFDYTLVRDAGDPACATAKLAVTWDDAPTPDSVTLNCTNARAHGRFTTSSDREGSGVHRLCVGNPDKGAPTACASYTIDLEPGSCEARGGVSPPCAVATTPPFEPDCVPNERANSPPCVTVTPIPIVCDTTGLGPSPPCATTPAPPPGETPSPESTLPATKTATSTPTQTPTATRTPTPASDAADGGGDVRINWTAVAVAVGVLGAAGGIAAGGWVWWKRV